MTDTYEGGMPPPGNDPHGPGGTERHDGLHVELMALQGEPLTLSFDMIDGMAQYADPAVPGMMVHGVLLINTVGVVRKHLPAMRQRWDIRPATSLVSLYLDLQSDCMVGFAWFDGRFKPGQDMPERVSVESFAMGVSRRWVFD